MLSLDGHSKRALEKKSVDKTGWQLKPCRKSPMKMEIKPSEQRSKFFSEYDLIEINV